MELEVDPEVHEAELVALLEALTVSGLGPIPPSGYTSAWRRAAARESIDDEEPTAYALSPRRTRGAKRA